jgi:hypothetical protein
MQFDWPITNLRQLQSEGLKMLPSAEHGLLGVVPPVIGNTRPSPFDLFRTELRPLRISPRCRNDAALAAKTTLWDGCAPSQSNLPPRGRDGVPSLTDEASAGEADFPWGP